MQIAAGKAAIFTLRSSNRGVLMDKGGIDWDILRRPIIIFCICLLVGSGLVGGAYYFNDKLSKELKRNKSIFRSISQRYLDVDQEERLLA